MGGSSQIIKLLDGRHFKRLFLHLEVVLIKPVLSVIGLPHLQYPGW